MSPLFSISFSNSIITKRFLANFRGDTPKSEPPKITDSAAGETTELVVSRLLKADLVGKCLVDWLLTGGEKYFRMLIFD